MLIQDLSFIEQTEVNDVNGGASAFTNVDVFAFGPFAGADAEAFGAGDSTRANTKTNTRSKLTDKYALSTATGTAVSYAVTRDGKNSSVDTSVSTGVDTSIFTI